jgi:GT2 family glycosyltransferase
MPLKPLDLVIAIVNHHTREWLRDCLDSIFESHGNLAYQVYVIDHSSSNGDADLVREAFS